MWKTFTTGKKTDNRRAKGNTSPMRRCPDGKALYSAVAGAARAGGTEISREEKAQFYGKPLPLMLYFKMSYKRCTSEMRQCLPQNAALQRCGPENSLEAIR